MRCAGSRGSGTPPGGDSVSSGGGGAVQFSSADAFSPGSVTWLQTSSDDVIVLSGGSASTQWFCCFSLYISCCGFVGCVRLSWAEFAFGTHRMPTHNAHFRTLISLQHTVPRPLSGHTHTHTHTHTLESELASFAIFTLMLSTSKTAAFWRQRQNLKWHPMTPCWWASKNGPDQTLTTSREVAVDVGKSWRHH